MVPIIAGEFERGTLPFEQPVAAGNLNALSSNLLIYIRLELPDFRAARQPHYQIARLGIYAHLFRSLEYHLNLLGIGARCNGEVIFQVSVMCIKNELDALVDIRNCEPAVLRHAIDGALEIPVVDIITHTA